MSIASLPISANPISSWGSSFVVAHLSASASLLAIGSLNRNINVTLSSGPGSVAGNQKGSGHMSLGVHKLIGPRVVAAGAKTLSGTTGTVEVPALSGAVTDYIVMLTGVSTIEAYLSTGLAAVESTWNFIITGGGSGEVVNWIIVKKGL